MERSILSVPGSTLWFVNSTQSLFKGYARNNEATSGDGDTASSVSGRHFNHSQFPWPTEGLHQNGSRVPQEFGLHSQQKKCVFNPVQRIKFLGFMMDFIHTKIFLPREKMRELVKQCRKFLQLRTVSAHKLAHLIRKMTATIPAVLPAALHYRALQWLKNIILWRNKQDYSALGILDRFQGVPHIYSATMGGH